jgi:hypothetical protein
MPYLITIDVQSGESYYLSGAQPPIEGIVGSDLNAGDLLHPLGNDSITINQTISRAYAGGPRETNIVELTGPVENVTLDTITGQTIDDVIGDQNVTYYLDKATGMLVEQDITITSDKPYYAQMKVTWTLTETNVWDASQPLSTLLTTIIAVVIVAVVIVIVVLVYRSRRKGRNRR